MYPREWRIAIPASLMRVEYPTETDILEYFLCCCGAQGPVPKPFPGLDMEFLGSNAFLGFVFDGVFNLSLFLLGI